MIYSYLSARSNKIVKFFGRSAAAKRIVAIAWLVLAGWFGVADAQESAYSEEQVKAAFLYHFGTYVAWPESATRRTDSLTIAVLGDDAVAKQLRAFLPGRTIQGRPVQARPIARIQDLRSDDVLFIGRQNNARLREIVNAVGTRPVLIVTDAADGLANGAMVNFQVVDQRVRFEISLRKAQDSGLMLSSRLLSAALRVETSSCWYDCGRIFAKPPADLALLWGRNRPDAGDAPLG